MLRASQAMETVSSCKSNSTSPKTINDLPDDVIARIVHFSVAFEHRNDHYSCSLEAATLLSVTHVNKRFRDIALEEPTFWAENIQPDVDAYPKVETFIARSADEPLKLISVLALPFQSVGDRGPVWKLLGRHFHRCTTFIVTLWPLDDDRPIEDLLNRAEALQSLVINVEPHEEDVDPSRRVPFLAYENSLASSNPTWNVSSFSRIRKLTVIQSSHRASEPKPSVPEWIIALSSLPSLESLYLSDAIQAPAYHGFLYPDTSKQFPKEHFHNIKSLELEGNLHACGQLVRSLRLRPHSVSLRMRWEYFPQWVQPDDDEAMTFAFLYHNLTPLLFLLAPAQWDTLRIDLGDGWFGLQGSNASCTGFYFDLELERQAGYSGRLDAMDRAIGSAISFLESRMRDWEGTIDQVAFTAITGSQQIYADMHPHTLTAVSQLLRSMEKTTAIYLDFRTIDHIERLLHAQEFPSQTVLPTAIRPQRSSDTHSFHSALSETPPESTLQYPAANAAKLHVHESAVLLPRKWAAIAAFLDHRAQNSGNARRIRALIVRCDTVPVVHRLEDLARVLTTIRLRPGGRRLLVEVVHFEDGKTWLEFETDENGNYISGPDYQTM